ncbi:MAG: glycosyltransferase family 39 protein [Blastocatellales bacterium]|nr:glycosyltransferase family 39 protein [Blastocatellales bacterium]
MKQFTDKPTENTAPDRSGKQSRSDYRAPLALSAIMLLGAVNFFYGIDRLPLIGPDEPRYAEVALEMYESGDWITPRLAGINWFEKPALLYWLAASGYALFGVNEGAARAGVALAALLGVLLVYFFGLKVGPKGLGITAGATLATLGLWIGFSRGATFDMPLAVCCAAALTSFFIWWETERSRMLWWHLCCAALGLAVLAKGLVGLVLPGVVIGSYLILTGGLGDFLRNWRRTIPGIGVFTAIASTWYGPMFARHGQEFVNEFFLAHHVERFLTDKYKHPQPFYFFFVVALAGAFPWIGFLLQAAVRDARRGRDLLRDKTARLRLFLWLWVLLPVLFFSFSGSKLPGYILPVFPAIALLIGLEMVGDYRRAATAAGALLLIAAAAGVWISGGSYLPASSVDGMAAIGAVAGAGVLILSFKLRNLCAIGVLCAAVALSVAAATHLLFPALGDRESIRELARLAAAQAAQGERLIFYLNSNHGINFYATELPLRDAHANPVTTGHGDEITEILGESEGSSLLLMAYDRWMPGLENNGSLLVERIGRQSGRSRCSPGCDWVLARVRRRSAAY